MIQHKIFLHYLLMLLFIVTLLMCWPQQSLANNNPCQSSGSANCSEADDAVCASITHKTHCDDNPCCIWIPPLPTPETFFQENKEYENDDEQEQNGPRLKIPELQITLPGLVFSDENKIQTVTDGDKTFFYIPWIGEYIKWLYNYSIGIIGLLALLAIMIGGFYWIMAGGSASRVSEAKSWISAAISGLALALASYLLLFTLNSNLVQLPSIKMMAIKTIDIEIVGDTSGPPAGTTPIQDEYPCPPVNTLAAIVSRMYNKTTYLYGGKYNYHPKKCPSQYCLDCSGFVDFVRKCAGLSDIGESNSTYYIFTRAKANNQRVRPNDTASSLGLIPGDLVGWPRFVNEKNEKKEGHVLMYIGSYDNKAEVFVDAHGPSNKVGQAIGIWGSLESIRSKYEKEYDGVYFYKRSQGYVGK